jgi:hypothetical protein
MESDGESPFEPEVPAPALEADTSVVRRGGRGRLLLAGVVGAGLVAAAVGVVASSGDDADAAEALRSAQDLVQSTEGYRFEELTERHSSTGDPDGAGTDTTTRTLLTGTVEAPDRWHVEDHPEEDFGLEMGSFESIRIGDQVYATGVAMPGSSGPAWVAMTVPDQPAPSVDELADIYGDVSGDDEYADEMRLDLALQAYLSDAAGDPAAVTRVITEATEPVVEEHRGDGGLLLRTTLPPDRRLAKVGDLPPVDALLQLDADRQPEQVRFTATQGSASAQVTITFSGWDDVPPIVAPGEADIDHTPWVSEEDLASADPALLLVPSAVPAPLELVNANVFDEGAMFAGDVEGEGDAESCPAVGLGFASQDDVLAQGDETTMSEDELDALYEDMDYLDITVHDRACSDGMYDDGYFDSELAGHPATGGGGYWEVALGDVVVDVSGSMDDEVLAAILTSMHPTSATALIASIPSWMADAMDQLGGMGPFPFPVMGMGSPASMGFTTAWG